MSPTCRRASTVQIIPLIYIIESLDESLDVVVFAAIYRGLIIFKIDFEYSHASLQNKKIASIKIIAIKFYATYFVVNLNFKNTLENFVEIRVQVLYL